MGGGARERREPHVTYEWLLSKFSISENIPAFSDLNCGLKGNRNFNSYKTEIYRLPAQYSALVPDHNYISGPNATSNDPRDWLLYPTGIIFKINAKQLPVKSDQEITCDEEITGHEELPVSKR